MGVTTRWIVGTSLCIQNAKFGDCVLKNKSLAQASFFRSSSRKVDILNNVNSLFGVIIVAVSFSQIREHASFKPEVILLTVFGTCLLIGAGQNAVFNRYILSNKVLASIGLISYPFTSGIGLCCPLGSL